MMTDKLEDLLYESGLTAQGCWDEFDDYAKQGIERLVKMIVLECAACCGSQADMRNIRKRFGLPVESNIKYPSPDAIGHYSQYGREYNIPKE